MGIVKDVDYWRNNLFAGTIIFLLPLCLIALVPGIYFCILTKQYTIAVVDIVTTISVLMIAFMPGINLQLRKIIFFGMVVILSCTLLLYLGLLGPGLLYLLAACIFSLLIFPTKYSYWPAWIITGICILFTLAIWLNIIELPRPNIDAASEWIAVSSNLVFLAFLLAALVPTLFRGLQETLNKEKELKETLRKQQQELQRALDQVKQKNKELEQFAYVASHDLHEPLRMITSFMGMLQNKYGDQLDDKAKSYIHFAVDGGKRMQKMISDLLELSRTGRSDTAMELVNLDDVLKQVQQNISKLIDENNAVIIIESPLPEVTVYRRDIERLFQNLLSNAIKFRSKDFHPVIRISCIEKHDSWQINIEDNGIGIEKDKFEKVFEIFSRLHTHDEYQGSGIGLAVCRKVVEQHGGIIKVKSNENKGSTFYFTIQK
ncbi:MAG: GHKL domain-containing protein [Ferruginibacter sp.]|nr:GHKL domain-containing protein [Ferruginibacter sp.]